jgi:hypothetical protein
VVAITSCQRRGADNRKPVTPRIYRTKEKNYGYANGAAWRGAEHAPLNGHNQNLGSSLVDPRLKPNQLALVAVLHMLEGVEQIVIPKSTRTLF